MTPPGKNRCIGAVHAGAQYYEDLVASRYNLTTARDPNRFLKFAQPRASLQAYEAWLSAYRRNDGTFLDSVVWGADRDLGGGQWLYGAMDDRYASNAARVFNSTGLNAAAHVAGKRVCVVGAWDGTECLLLHALGAASVDAIDEVPAFCDMAQAQYDAWQIPGRVHSTSLYEMNLAQSWQAYDLVYVPGVLYHLTDVVAATVILWSMLRPGGVLAFESIADPRGRCGARYIGAGLAGWNWWSPTPECYETLMRDCGFTHVKTVDFDRGRGWFMGMRGVELPAASAGAAGFSRPDILRTIAQLVKT